MSIRVKEVKTKKDLRTFIYLPEKIHKNHRNWVPPIYMDEFDFFNPKKNKAFDYSDTIMLLAYQDGIPVGRIMGIIQHRYNQLHNENDARFAFMETYKDPAVFKALISSVEQWAREKGAKNIVGPLGFSDKDPQGFMIMGFDEPPIISANLNFPFMPEFLEQNGYRKKYDLVVYQIPVPEKIPDFYKAIYHRVMSRHPQWKVLEFQTKKALKPYIKPVLTLLNETFKDIYAFSPFEEYEMEDFAKRYLPVLDPEFIKAVEDENGQLIAFIIAMPEISEGIRRARGRLLPTGIFKILAAQKKTDMLTLLLGGIKEKYRRKGLDVILGYHILEAAIRRGFKTMDSHLELEHNRRVRAEMERMGGKVYKRFRIYQKKL